MRRSPQVVVVFDLRVIEKEKGWTSYSCTVVKAKPPLGGAQHLPRLARGVPRPIPPLEREQSAMANMDIGYPQALRRVRSSDQWHGRDARLAISSVGSPMWGVGKHFAWLPCRLSPSSFLIRRSGETRLFDSQVSAKWTSGGFDTRSRQNAKIE